MIWLNCCVSTVVTNKLFLNNFYRTNHQFISL